MRVISGSARGLKLESLCGLDTRPTLDRVKEAIFSMLFLKCNDACVLDLFAGSGAMGIEALSRGASKCTFVDNSKDAVGIIKCNVKKANFEDKSTIIYEDFEKFLCKTDEKFDLVFLDPPYKSGFYQKAMSLIYERALLRENAIVVAESDRESPLDPSSNYRIIKEKNYGRVNVCLLEAVWKK